ncbi:MAG: hypothetical protein EBZ59_08260 [Planctomycetia bacterium]|nr:hypothetical protein [Planctomycetia bacterium]
MPCVERPSICGATTSPEFVAKEVQEWLARASVRTLSIRKASPCENGYVESFNGGPRDEPLDRELFLGLPGARVVLDQWRMDYNHRRPHGGRLAVVRGVPRVVHAAGMPGDDRLDAVVGERVHHRQLHGLRLCGDARQRRGKKPRLPADRHGDAEHRGAPWVALPSAGPPREGGPTPAHRGFTAASDERPPARTSPPASWAATNSR